MTSETKANRITLNPVADDAIVGNYVQSINVIETQANFKKYKANRRYNKYFFDKDLRASENVPSGNSALKTNKGAPENEVTSNSLNGPSKILENLIESFNYVDVNDNNDSNYNGMYVGGKLYPDHVLKCKKDPLNVILQKVTEIHERITKNSRKMKAFECNICEFSYLSITDFYGHLKSKHGADRIKFMYIEFLSRIALISCKYHDVKSFKIKCPKCEITFQNSTVLKQHTMRTSFQCMQCKKDYNDCLKWKKHISSCDSERHVMCDLGMEYPKYTNYDKREECCKESGPIAYFCLVCPMFFQDMDNLIEHQKSFHPKKFGHEAVFTISTCWTCNIKYVGDDELHSCKDFFKCPICLKLFDSEMSRDDHLNAMKTSDADCANCKKLFITNCENLMHDCNEEYIPSALFICKICNKSHTSSDEMYKHVKSRHIKYFLSVKDHVSTNLNDVNQKEYIKGKITTSQEEKTNLIAENKSLCLNNIQKYKDLCITTYAKKKIVFNKAETQKKYDSVKRKRNLEEVIDIMKQEIHLDTDLVKEAKRKRKNLQKSINESKTEIIENFNKKDSQVFHYVNKQPNELDLVKIENIDGIQEEENFIYIDVKNLEDTETFLGECGLNKVIEHDFNAKESSAISYSYVGEHTQKIQLPVRKKVNISNEKGIVQIIQNTAINEKLRFPMIELKNALKIEPMALLIDDDLIKEKNDVAININVKIEEKSDNKEESGPNEEKELGLGPFETVDDLEEKRTESVIVDNSQFSRCANRHSSRTHSRKMDRIENIHKGSNGTSPEEIDLGKVSKAHNIGRNVNTTSKEEIVDFEEGNTQIIQNPIGNEKLTTNSISSIDVKNEIKTELLEECFEGDVAIVSNEPVQELQISRIIGNIEIKSEYGEPVMKESSIGSEIWTRLPEIVKIEQETFECGASGQEKCVKQNEPISDKEREMFFDAKCSRLKTEIEYINRDFKKQKYNCKICARSFNTLAIYYDHYICHNLNKYQCPYCKVIVDMENFYLHCFTHVILNYHESITIDKNLKMKCKQCHKKVQKEYLLSHYEWHSLINTKTNVMEFPKMFLNTVLEDLKRKESLCMLCERNFKDLKRHLIEHLYANAHANKKENGGLLCQICKKLLYNKYVFKKHMLRHTSMPAYECKVCNRTYKGRVRFIYHQNKHKSACVWCDNCEGKFTTKEKLIQHLKEKHQTARVIRCDICKIVYRSQSLLDDHNKVIHEENIVVPSIGQVKKPLITYERSSKLRYSK